MLFIWVALYGLVNLMPEFFCFPEESSIWLRTALLAVYVWLFLLWIVRTERRKEAGLLMPSGLGEAPIILLPLAVFPVCNLLMNEGLSVNVGFVVQMLCAAWVEELFFRGFLLSFLQKCGTVKAILLTSAAFALLHGMNLTENPDSTYVLLQICCSFCVSIYYCCVTVRFGSILPGVAAHFLTNITGTGSTSGKGAFWGPVCCSAVCAIWSLFLIMNIKNKNEETQI